MAKKATEKGREAALRQSRSTARFETPDSGGGVMADPPIVITGGGSIVVGLNKKYKDDGDDSKGRKRFKYHDLDLVSVTIDGQKHDLQKNSVIEFEVTTSAGGGGGKRPDQES